MSDDETYPDSGPFCRHYGTPGDCDTVCAACGHTYGRHGCGEFDQSCLDCTCEKFEDEEEN